MWEERYPSSATLSLSLSSKEQDTTLASLQMDRVEDVFFSRSFQQNIVKSLLKNEATFGFGASENKTEAPYHEIFTEHVKYSTLPRELIQISLIAKSPSQAQTQLSNLLQLLNEQLAPGDALSSVNQKLSNLEVQITQIKDELKEKEIVFEEANAKQDMSLSPRSRDRVLSVREAIQDVEVSISATNAKIDGILRQLNKEEEVFNLRARLRALEVQKEKVNLRLQEAETIYATTSPEVVSLQKELDNINIEMASIVENPLVVASNAAEGESLYEQLRKQLTLERVERESLISRHASLEKILRSESQKDSANQEQKEVIAEAENALNQVKEQLQGLQTQRAAFVRERDDILASSPQLRIIDAPSQPQSYSGLGFIEFLIMGPIFAFGVPFVMASTMVITDTRVRTLHKLRRATPRSVPILGVIPHYNSPKTARLFRKALFGLAIWGVFVFSIYFTVGVIGLKGM